jgi:ribosomal protein S18 acetylase RimI-like enzyme
MIQYQLTSTKEELVQIIALQQKNLPQNISLDEQQAQGFVTVQHSFNFLEKMHNSHPHIIATYNNKVIGYALCMLQEFKSDIPILVPMFNQIENTICHQKKNINYVVMGQICIDKNYRKKGVFRGLYTFMKQTLSKKYNAIITEVDVKNTRSLNAHKAVGFEIFNRYKSNHQNWELIILYT